MKSRAGPPEELAAQRAYLCRLSPDRWLESLDEAQGFLADRGMLSISPTTSIPSVFGACAPNPDPLARGFAAWPTDKWWWPGALQDAQRTRLLRGHVLLVHRPLFEGLAPLFQVELARADDGAFGPDAQRLVRYLDESGPTVLQDARAALGFAARTMATVRERLERVGAVLSDDVELPAKNKEGHIHTSRLSRADQVVPPRSGDADAAHRALLTAAIRAAAVVHETEVTRWFAWPAVDALEALRADGQVESVAGGWLTA